MRGPGDLPPIHGGRSLELLSGAGAPEMDIFGSGPDEAAIRAEGERRGVRLRFRGPLAEPDGALLGRRALVNLSRSEGLCTVTAEALAMGKYAIVPEHPSNEFFRGFRACLRHRNARELGENLERALAEPPPPLTADERRRLSWEAATDRLLAVLGLARGGAW